MVAGTVDQVTGPSQFVKFVVSQLDTAYLLNGQVTVLDTLEPGIAG